MPIFVQSSPFGVIFPAPSTDRDEQCIDCCQEIFTRFWNGADAPTVRLYVNELRALIGTLP